MVWKWCWWSSECLNMSSKCEGQVSCKGLCQSGPVLSNCQQNIKKTCKKRNNSNHHCCKLPTFNTFFLCNEESQFKTTYSRSYNFFHRCSNSQGVGTFFWTLWNFCSFSLLNKTLQLHHATHTTTVVSDTTTTDDDNKKQWHA